MSNSKFLIVFGVLLFLPIGVFADNVEVGTWQLHDFKIIYIFPHGEITGIVSDYSTNSYKVYYTTPEPTKLEILLPIQIFQNESLDYFSENNLIFSDAVLGISENQEIISFIFSVEKGSNYVTISGIKDMYFDYDAEKFSSYVKINGEKFENDFSLRMKTNENSKKAYDLINQANNMQSLGKSEIQKSLNIYDDAIMADPDFVSAWQGKFQTLVYLEKYDDALKLLKEYELDYGVEMNLDKGLLYVILGNTPVQTRDGISLIQNDLDDSFTYEKLSYAVNTLINFGFENDAKNLIVYLYESNSDYDKGLVLQDYGLYQDSIEFFDKSIHGNSYDDDAYAEKSNSLFYLGDFDGALENADNAISINPMNAYAYVLKADALQSSKDFEDAIKNYNMAIQIIPEYDYAYGEKAVVYLTMNDIEPSLQNIAKAIEIDPQNDYYYFVKSVALMINEDYESANESIIHAIELNHENDSNYVTEAVILMHLENYEGAQNSINNALAINPSNDYAYYINGLIALESKDYDKAITNFDKSLEINPMDADTLSAKTWALSEIESTGITTEEQIIPESQNSKGGGCLIATATYGSELAPQVQQLRELRDNSLLQTASGTSFMSSFNDFYYSFSPTIADWERENSVFKEAVKITLTPMITSLSILNYVDMDSESEVLGYGISLILLNVGMYFVAPGIVIHTIKKKL